MMNSKLELAAPSDAETRQQWLEIRLETTEIFGTDALEEALFAAGALSVTLTGKADEVMLIEPAPGELPLWTQGVVVTGLFDTFDEAFDLVDSMAVLSACLQTDDLPLLASQTLVDRQWELEWTRYFHPVVFGDNLWICPSNQKVPEEKVTAETQVITLDPGLAFGTGTHPTTAMALTYIATHDLRRQHVIDYGCGSGVLGIAALKMGAAHVLMTDIDPQALATARDNAKINGVESCVSYYLPDEAPSQKTSRAVSRATSQTVPQTADLLIANILLEPLLMLKATFVSHCHTGTRMVLTGLLTGQVPQIIARYQGDFANFDITESGDWAMVVATSTVA